MHAGINELLPLKAQEKMSCTTKYDNEEVHFSVYAASIKTIQTGAACVKRKCVWNCFLFSIPPLCPPFSSHLLLSSFSLSLFLHRHTHTHTVVFVGAIAPRQAAWNWSLQRVLDYQRDTATRKLGDTRERGREEHKREAGRGKECRGVSMGLGGG